jgi:3-oxoacyl-[acyl-carrier-protein] synthase-3
MTELETFSPALDEARPAVRAATLAGLGTALPGAVVGNDRIAARLGVDDAWIVKRTGIRARRHLADGERLSDLAAAAGAAALADAGLDIDDVDLVLVATSSADELVPNAAPLVAAALGSSAGAVDVGAACTGFLAGLDLATATVESGRAEHVLLIGADALSRHTNPDDRRTAALFGDGAGATVVSATRSGAGVGPVVLGSDGANGSLLTAPRDPGMIEMNGHDTFVQAVRRLCEVTPQAIERAGLTLDEIDLFVYHQANTRILDAVGERLGLPAEKVVDCIGELGNTSAASLPLALDHARDRLRPGTQVLLGAVGAGFMWGACVVEWGGA